MIPFFMKRGFYFFPLSPPPILAQKSFWNFISSFNKFLEKMTIK